MNLTLVRRGLALSWKGPLIAVIVVAGMILLAMGIYGSLDLSMYDNLPEALRRIMSLPIGASAEVFAYNEMLNFIGSLALAGVAIAIGVSSVAGEEARRTISPTLGTQTSRTSFAVSKAIALTLIVVISGAAIWGSSELAPLLVDATKGETHLLATCIHLTANALLHGFLAFGIASATGRTTLGGGVAAAVLTLGMIFAGLLPMWESAENVAKAIPWYWFTGHGPLLNGLDGGYLALQLGFTALFAIIGLVGFARRDLRLGSGTTLVARLLGRGTPTLAMPGRASSITALLLSRNLGLLLITGVTMFGLMGLLMGPLYVMLEDQLAEMSKSMPSDVLAMIGVGDMSTPEGFFWAETMGMMGPIAVILMGTAAASGLARLERQRQLAMVLGAPVSRSRVLASTALTMTIYVAITAALSVGGIWGGSLISDLGVEPRYIIGAGALLFGLGMAYSSLALLVAAATGSPSAAIWTAVGAGTIGHFALAYGTLSDDWRWLARLSPHYYYAPGEPLLHPLNWGRLGVLLAIAAIAIALAFPLFKRRDIRL